VGEAREEAGVPPLPEGIDAVKDSQGESLRTASTAITRSMPIQASRSGTPPPSPEGLGTPSSPNSPRGSRTKRPTASSPRFYKDEAEIDSLLQSL
jgi:hypothetical protein